MTRMVVALFDEFKSANDAVHELVDNGIRRDDISYMASDSSGDYSRELGINRTDDTMTTEGSSGASVGAGVGAAVGGIGGVLVGLGALLIPGIGPVVAAGPLAAAVAGLVGAGAGAVAGGILGALVDLGIPEETAGYYAEGVRRGGTLITVKVDDYMADRTVEILNRHNPVNVNERAGQWKETGWSGFTTGEQMERVDYGTRSQTGVSGQSSAYGTGAPGGMEPSRSARGPQNIEPGGSESSRFSGTGTAMGSDLSSSTPTGRSDTDYTAMGSTGMGTGTAQDFSMYDARFRSHFQTSPYSREYTYDQYAPAYRYGYDLAYNDQYKGRPWEEIEPYARGEWEARNQGPWENFKDSIRHAWENVKDAFD